ncbi:WD40 repeat-like protein [Terfezia boudieri ATCC MYA-4762]|uniref:WD40 repeat-like protein n=1 Tax=Terfezia boudieri ATCC MYA-4762 TaxID=1051890 RepID=A0A3N4LP98_9PEZI|nr:WD40 repeat-like protein [Terfezia boudieri ATCC MYA-4762]
MSGVHPSRRAYVDDEDAMDTDGIDFANVPIDRNYLIPSHATGIAPEKASAILSQFDRKKRAAAIAVPTDDGRVRAKLRELGEPITLFGEGPGDRRDRLRYLLYEIEEAKEGHAGRSASGTPGPEDVDMGEGEEGKDEEDEEFYTPGIPELLDVRRELAWYSLPRAKKRIEYQKVESTIPLQKHIKHRRGIKERLQGYGLFGTQIAGERPVSIARISPDSGLMAAGNLGGGIKLLSIPNMDEKVLFRGHTDRVGGLSWHPQATVGLDAGAANLASGAGDGMIHLWSLDGKDTPLATLNGHSARVCRIDHHPSGKYLASASFDTTWRLWDLPTQTELLLQEGHSREVYSIAFQNDGALVASGGLDSIGRIWDLRTGRTIMVLDGHIREITGLAWFTDGYRVVSASGDASCKIWDVRMVKCAATVPGHKGLVSDVRVFTGDGLPDVVMNGVDGGEVEMRTEGTYWVTSGFDGNINVFSTDDWALVKSLSGHSGHVTSVDISRDGRWIVSSGQDRTCKLWCQEDMAF